ncbi:MAG: cold shock domain-containing protein [Acidimicrobiia bacterium]|nr:cold shock domain-containing protein [Acidimicrobiia bacterium]
MAQGTVKTYDPTTGGGFVLADDGTTVPLADDALDGSIFLMLRQGQRVVYDTVERGGLTLATRLRLGQGKD